MHFDCKCAPISILCFVRWGIQDNEREVDRNSNLIFKIRSYCIVEEQAISTHSRINNDLFRIVEKRFFYCPLFFDKIEVPRKS